MSISRECRDRDWKPEPHPPAFQALLDDANARREAYVAERRGLIDRFLEVMWDASDVQLAAIEAAADILRRKRLGRR